jgi:hypothetical protein
MLLTDPESSEESFSRWDARIDGDRDLLLSTGKRSALSDDFLFNRTPGAFGL